MRSYFSIVSPREYITVGIEECVLTRGQRSAMILKIRFVAVLHEEVWETTIGLRVSILASGSSGNLTLLETERTRLLVDAGLGKRETLARLAAVEKTVEHLDGILITHSIPIIAVAFRKCSAFGKLRSTSPNRPWTHCSARCRTLSASVYVVWKRFRQASDLRLATLTFTRSRFRTMPRIPSDLRSNPTARNSRWSRIWD